jgi:hypothetical protein
MSLENTGNDITSTAAVYENVMLKDTHTEECLGNIYLLIIDKKVSNTFETKYKQILYE